MGVNEELSLESIPSLLEELRLLNNQDTELTNDILRIFAPLIEVKKMIDWSKATVESCLESLSFRKIPKVLARDYKPSGSYPIIDQGQNLIAGWTDDDSVLISTDLPIVIFGDHTRVFKYIDFPFVRGADGTQLLKPKAGIEPLFFYYACRAINIPSRGYNRHFKALKEKDIPIPPIGEQRNIARTLRRIDDAILLQDKQLQVTTDMKRAAMQTLFTRGLKNEPQKETEIGPIPESWEVGQLGQFADIISTRMQYTALEKMVNANEDGVRVLGIKVADMNLPGNEIELQTATLERKLDRATVEQRCAPPRTIIFPKRGAAIATNKKRISTEWTAFDPNVIGVVAGNRLDQTFLFQWFQMFDLRTITEPGPTPQLNKKNLLPLVIPIPPTRDEQREIVSILDTIDLKIDLHRKKRAVLDDLFKALLHKLMTGEIRVADLNLSHDYADGA